MLYWRRRLQPQIEQKQVRMGFILSVVSGVLILMQGTFRVVRGQWALELGIGEFRRHALGGTDLRVLGIMTVVVGAVILLGAYLMRASGRERMGAITVLVFSTLSISTGGGYLVGLILGVVGSAIVLINLSPKPAPT